MTIWEVDGVGSVSTDRELHNFGKTPEELYGFLENKQNLLRRRAFNHWTTSSIHINL